MSYVRRTFWLIMKEHGAPRINSHWLNTPTLKKGEIAVVMTVNVPESLWHPDTPEIQVTLPEPAEGSRPAAMVTVPRETTVIAVRVSDHPETTVEATWPPLGDAESPAL